MGEVPCIDLKPESRWLLRTGQEMQGNYTQGARWLPPLSGTRVAACQRQLGWYREALRPYGGEVLYFLLVFSYYLTIYI